VEFFNNAYGITESEMQKGLGLKLKILEPARAAPAPEAATQGSNIQRALQATINQALEKLTTSNQEPRNTVQAERRAAETASVFEENHNYQILANETVINPEKKKLLKEAIESVEVSKFYKRHLIKEDYFY